MKKILILLLLTICSIGLASCLNPIEELNTHTIKFVNYDRSLLEEVKVKDGVTPTYSKDTPVRASDDNYDYEFSGWDPQIGPAKSDTTYQAVYTQKAKQKEKVIAFFMNGDIKLAEVEVEKGGTPVYNGSTPTKASDEEFDYTFEGWAPEVGPIDNNTTYQAQFDAHPKSSDPEPDPQPDPDPEEPYDVETPWIVG